ncbi:MAG: hypothetical protein R2731_04095 [Nocardioides sp.]
MAQGGGALVDAYFATSVLTLAVTAAGFAIASALRPRAEEDDGRVEELLGTALPRSRWLFGHVVLTLVGTVAVVDASGVGLALGYLIVGGDATSPWVLVRATFGYVAPVLVLAAVARALHGWLPWLAWLSWLGLAFAAVVVLFGEVLDLPQWLQDISPFEHVALVPAASFEWAPVLILAGLVGVLSAVGQLGFRRRDIVLT